MFLRNDLLLKCVSYTEGCADIDSGIELLAEYISRHVNTYNGARLVLALNAVANATSCSEGRLAGWTRRGRNVKAVAAGCRCADASGSCEVPQPWARVGGYSSRRSAGSECDDGELGEHGEGGELI
jgi:hypothetical protein